MQIWGCKLGYTLLCERVLPTLINAKPIYYCPRRGWISKKKEFWSDSQYRDPSTTDILYPTNQIPGILVFNYFKCRKQSADAESV